MAKALYSYIEKYQPDTAYLLNKNIFSTKKVDKTRIQFDCLFADLNA